jgi:uncharacterized protein (UPF0333 family)
MEMPWQLAMLVVVLFISGLVYFTYSSIKTSNNCEKVCAEYKTIKCSEDYIICAGPEKETLHKVIK